MQSTRNAFWHVLNSSTPSCRRLNQKLSLQTKTEHAELEELREMKDDVVRKERAQATIITNQARRLEELDQLYKVRLVCPGKTTLMLAKAVCIGRLPPKLPLSMHSARAACLDYFVPAPGSPAAGILCAAALGPVTRLQPKQLTPV